MHLNTAKTTDVLHKLFGKTNDERTKQLMPEHMRQYYPDLSRYPFGIQQVETPLGGMNVRIGFKGMSSLLSFSVEYYPSCCGSRIFHAFSVDETKVSQEQLDEIMNTLISENRGNDGVFGQSGRIELMMVERGRGLGRDPLTEVEPVANPKIDYKLFWNFFHKYGKRVRDRLELNYNTSNIVHNMEVIL